MNDDMCTAIRLGSSPGIGKTYISASLPFIYPQYKFIYIVNNYDLVDNLLDEFKKFGDTTITVVKGKQRLDDDNVKLCSKPKGEEYYPGCKNCDHKDNGTCSWKNQFQISLHSQIIITTITHLKRLGEGRMLVFDESPEDQMMLDCNITPNLELCIICSKKESIFCGNTKKKFTFYKKVKLHNDFIISSESEYGLSQLFNQAKNIQRVNNNLFGLRKKFLPVVYEKLIFCCATTPNELMCEMFDINIAFWDIYESSKFDNENINNLMLKIKCGKSHKNSGWSKQYSGWALNTYMDKLSKGLINKNILIITKLAFKGEIKRFFPNADYVHYKKGRGINTYNKEYDLQIIYGRYGLTPVQQEKYKRLGFSEKAIKQMDSNEALQCAHRGRAIIHPETPILHMGNMELFKHIEPISWRALDDASEHYDDNLDNMSLVEIGIMLGQSKKSNKTKRAKEYLQARRFMNYVLMRKYEL